MLPGLYQPETAATSKCNKQHGLICKYHELGLGRGVNATDPQMWNNKTSFIVRKVKIEGENSNIIETVHCPSGEYKKYEKVVWTVSSEQRRIQLLLKEPTSQVKIGMDVHNTRSSTSMMHISGTKIKKKTISFSTDFEDIPQYVKPDKSQPTKHDLLPDMELLLVNEDIPQYVEPGKPQPNKHDLPKPCSSANKDSPQKEDKNENFDFKEKFKKWISRRCDIKLDKEEDLLKLDETKKEEIFQICWLFVKDTGITHYVSSVELGAMEYKSANIASQQSRIGGGIRVGAAQYAEGGLSGLWQKLSSQNQKQEHSIGKFQNREVQEGHEAVIGFQIQPIYKLVPIPVVQPLLYKAVKEYIASKAQSTGEGPFHIYCTIPQGSSSNKTGQTKVYWHVSDSNEVMGTEEAEEASKFYILPTRDREHPSEFFIMHGKDSHIYEAPLYLATDTDIFGRSRGPLKLESTVLISEARFCLHSRLQSSFACMMCLSTPACLDDWFTGNEPFYINCSRQKFKIDGYIAMGQVSENEEPENREYQTQTVRSVTDQSEEKMLFRLQKPEEKKPKEKKQEKISATLLLEAEAAPKVSGSEGKMLAQEQYMYWMTMEGQSRMLLKESDTTESEQ